MKYFKELLRSLLRFYYRILVRYSTDDLLYKKGIEYINMKKIPQAYLCIKELRRRNTRESLAKCYIIYAFLSLEFGDREKAREYIIKARDLKPKDQYITRILSDILIE